MPRFKKGENGGAKGGVRPGAGRPSELHRAECRRLFEEGELRELFKGAAEGKAVDFFVTLSGKVKKVPASFRNRLLAGFWLGEQGFGKAPQEVTHSISVETLEIFEKRLIGIFQKYFPKLCPHCRTAIAMPPEVGQEILELSKIFEQAPLDANDSQTASV